MLNIETDAAMRALGAQLAHTCPPRCVIYLRGELGAGKSTLARGFLQALGHKGAVRSPTYTLVEPYDLPQCQVYHLDLYRLADPEELEFLGLRDWLDQDVILLVEWPQKGAGVLPAADLVVEIQYSGQGRAVSLTPISDAGMRFKATLAQLSHTMG
ncbi:tRNA threonylcarbamoyladenosine biosynthesis protein TsaE [Candidatus Tenderia electrophaga]|jgi:tRNA threonylcarbamoyladenosine biosynthesis protein TsaE|uniref:tRNA threonylcarbamoyladenosine biosynthesis protein TsaE n=1 Tax=Candidatus Tenderia electrophaga TaxID=1748243 RepID=A0A0S2TED6_9GAMM|nr:tRNA threonylcarbamoyladenosine biosynthesis protein TsaE [Candidatus Tenderia electrophaga]